MIPRINIYYFPYTFKSNAKGEAPIYCKITMYKESKRFATGISIPPKQWDASKQKAKGKTAIANDINIALEAITQELQNIEKTLGEQQANNVSLSEIYFYYKQGMPDNNTFLKLMKERLNTMEKLIGKRYAKDTFRKFNDVYKHTECFIKKQYNMNDIPLRRLDYPFIASFQQYLLNDRKQIPNSVNKTLQKVIETAKYAVKIGILDKNPFVAYEPLRVPKKNITFLTEEEINLLATHNFSQPRLENVKNIYLFSIYTGLAYAEATALCKKHIIYGLDGELWISITRQKTSNDMQIPLLTPALRILEKYNFMQKNYNESLLPMISNQKMNSYFFF